MSLNNLPSLVIPWFPQISQAERRDAELYYLSHISKQGLTPNELGEKLYSRFMELCEGGFINPLTSYLTQSLSVYGRPDMVHKPADTLKKRLICLSCIKSEGVHQPHVVLGIQCFRVLGSPSGEALQKQSPDVKITILSSISLKVFRLKLLKSLKLSLSHNIILWLVLENNSIWHFGQLDDLNRSLDWWGMNEDCKVVYSVE